MAIRSPLPSGGVTVIAVLSVFLLVILSVIARFYSRHLQRKAVALNDHLIVAGLVFTIGLIGIGYALVLNGGAGLHMAEASRDNIATTLKLFVAAPLLWGLATSTIKLSILCFYTSIFPSRTFRHVVYAVMTVTVLQLLAIILRTFLLCTPFSFTWNKTVRGGSCGNRIQAYLPIAITNLIIDLTIVALPMKPLWGLKLPFKKKMVISAILFFGLVICAITAARIRSVLDLHPRDFTYTLIPDIIYGRLEVELGIINACLPLLRPLLHKLFGSGTVFTGRWTQKSDLDASPHRDPWNKQTAARVPRTFHRLEEDMHPLAAMTATTHTHVQSVPKNGKHAKDIGLQAMS